MKTYKNQFTPYPFSFKQMMEQLQLYPIISPRNLNCRCVIKPIEKKK